MSWGDTTSVESNAKAPAKVDPRVAEPRKAFGQISGDSSETVEPLVAKRVVVLDMGEASREQGFRLNGCR